MSTAPMSVHMQPVWTQPQHQHWLPMVQHSSCSWVMIKIQERAHHLAVAATLSQFLYVFSDWVCHSQQLVWTLKKSKPQTKGISLADSERISRGWWVWDRLIHFLSCCARGCYTFWDVSKRLVNGVNGYTVEEQDLQMTFLRCSSW